MSSFGHTNSKPSLRSFLDSYNRLPSMFWVHDRSPPITKQHMPMLKKALRALVLMLRLGLEVVALGSLQKPIS